MLPRYPGDVAIAIASDPDDIAGIAKIELLLHFQDNILETVNSTAQINMTLIFRFSEDEGILKTYYEKMFF